MKQTQRILEYCRMHGGITSKEAAEALGCMRLAARIADLEDEGHHFRRTKQEAQNRFGEKTHFTRYSLLEEE